MVRILNKILIVSALMVGAQLHADTTPSDEHNGTVLQQQGDAMVSQIKEDLDHATSAQAKARSARDVIKLNCVNDGLLVTKQLANVAEDAHGKLGKAIQANDAAGQQAQLKTLSDSLASANSSKVTIDGCVGAAQVTLKGPNGAKITVSAPHVIDNPTNDCDNLGLSHCTSQPLEYVAFASPFTPN